MASTSFGTEQSEGSLGFIATMISDEISTGQPVQHRPLYHYLADFHALLAPLADKEWEVTALNFACIDHSTVHFPKPKSQGSFFRVSLLESADFLKQTRVPDFAHYHFPPIVAVKTPRFDSDEDSPKNRQIFASIANEVRILTHEMLRGHKNIVSFAGCCWQNMEVGPFSVVPSLVLEGAALGDLEHYRKLRSLTMRERLGLCMCAVAGVGAIHNAGIIHCDIKPRNILVFKKKDQGFIAKISDFGSSIFIQQFNSGDRVPIGTKAFAPPECLGGRTEFDKNGLFHIDLYSLGIALLFIVRGHRILHRLYSAKPEELDGIKKGGGLFKWLDNDSSQDTYDTSGGVRGKYGQRAAEDERSEEIYGWVAKQTARQNSTLVKSRVKKGRTDENWKTLQESVGAGEKSFRQMMERMLATDPHLRLETSDGVLKLVRGILCQVLREEFDPGLRGVQNEEQTFGSLMKERISPQRIEIKKLKSNEESAFILHEGFRNIRRVGSFIGKHQLGQIPKRRRMKWLTVSPPPALRHYLKHRVDMMCCLEPAYDSHLKSISHMKKIYRKWHRQRNRVMNISTSVEVDSSLEIAEKKRYLAGLPLAVRRELTNCMKHLADSANETDKWYHRAPFEYAIMLFTFLNGSKDSPVSEALDYLHQAAIRGNYKARCIAGWMHQVFSRNFPVSPDIEIEWLFEASCRTSITARKRLRGLDTKKYADACNMAPFDCSIYDNDLPDLRNLPPIISVSLLHVLASIGRLSSFKQLASLPMEMCNSQNSLGETPLLAACHHGHADDVELLLQFGADPSIGTYQGVHPLHFLGAFKDEDIPRIGRLLFENGAKLNMHSWAGYSYRDPYDSLFGVEDGTPLLWAVISGNATATRALIDLGADAFECKKVEGLHFPNHAVVYWSPVEWAIATFQLNLLKILLSNKNRQRHISQKLNTRRAVGPDVRSSPFLLAFEDSSIGRFPVILLHGEKHPIAQLETVEFLLKCGADPLNLSQEKSGRSVHPVELICESGTTPLVDYLWNYNNGMLRPSPELWAECIGRSVHFSNKAVFRYLVKHRADLPENRGADNRAILKSLRTSSDAYYTSTLIKLYCQRLLPDFTSHLEDALMFGPYDSAKLFVLRGRCDLVSRQNGDTLLGRLISCSFIRPPSRKGVDMLLNLAPRKEKLFWNVVTTDKCQFSALQFAARGLDFDENLDAKPDEKLFQIVLKHFESPDFLNAKVRGSGSEYSGCTALHISIKLGHTKITTRLLYSAGIEVNLQNDRLETPTDLSIMYHENLVNKHYRARASESDDREMQNAVSEAASLVFTLVTRHGGKTAIFFAVIFRISPESFLIMHRDKGKARISQQKLQLLGQACLKSQELNQLLTLCTRQFIPFVDIKAEYGRELFVQMGEFIEGVFSTIA